MRAIDVHAHLVPRSAWRAAETGRDWHGYRYEAGEGVGTFVGGGRRIAFTSPKVRFTPEERLQDMDAQGVDVQVVSIHTPFFGYHLDGPRGLALAREVNDEIAAMAPTANLHDVTHLHQDERVDLEVDDAGVNRDVDIPADLQPPRG